MSSDSSSQGCTDLEQFEQRFVLAVTAASTDELF
jgi:hypothetical protein